MDSNQLRSAFLKFFEDRSHTVRPSASLIPVDPTLLLNNAGMVPFKPYFLGEEPAPYPRAVSSQKCVRTVDIDIIGTTARHASFFEMLGNFSFGDYFKEDAIPWAYELVTEAFGMDPEFLWFTVHESDDEAAQIWLDKVGVKPERLQRRDKDNFWQMGVAGPCGPSSEIFFDRGSDYGPEGGPVVDEERFVEIWNLVFMQNIQDVPYHVVGDLPAKSIDTGMGLERMATVLQGADTLFDIDTIRHVLDTAAAFAGVTYGADPMVDVSLRVLADHGRAMTFLIGDGVVPSNDGRGYVLRRILRRAVRHAWRLGGEGLITPTLVQATVEVMAPGYPELLAQQDFVTDVVTREETRFRQTLQSGHSLLEGELETVPADGLLSGSTTFKLHDTFGFPVELTKEIAAERGVEVDVAAFEVAMEEQRNRARAAWKGSEDSATADAYRVLLDDIGPSDFLGYVEEASRGRILALLREGSPTDRVEEGQDVEVFLDRTPFYAEAGGQVGDTGLIETETGRLVVRDTQAGVPGLNGHRATVATGFVQVGQDADARIDSPRREGIRKSHTGTHVLHWALRHVLGQHVQQAGSLVQNGRLRFDFSHFGGLDEEEFAEVERIANERVTANAGVRSFETSKDEAQSLGALAFFGDKYGEVVRVVEIGDYSKELCGGTHTPSAGQVGPLLVLGESSIGSNLRRIEALSGDRAYEYFAQLRRQLTDTGRLLHAKPEEVPAKVAALLERAGALEEEVAAVGQKARSEIAVDIAESAETINDRLLAVAAVGEMPPDQLRVLALQVRDRIDQGVVVLGCSHAGKGALIGAVTSGLVTAGLSAADLILPAARVLGGGGSRDPELAQAGGPQGDRLQEALDAAREAAARALAEV
jgi:alanyl-tRNA synthetase